MNEKENCNSLHRLLFILNESFVELFMFKVIFINEENKRKKVPGRSNVKQNENKMK